MAQRFGRQAWAARHVVHGEMLATGLCSSAEHPLEVCRSDNAAGRGHGADRFSARPALPRASDGQAFAALGAAGVDDRPAATSLHANEKAMGACPANFGGLVGAFHGSFSDVSLVCRRSIAHLQFVRLQIACGSCGRRSVAAQFRCWFRCRTTKIWHAGARGETRHYTKIGQASQRLTDIQPPDPRVDRKSATVDNCKSSQPCNVQCWRSRDKFSTIKNI